ncbi:hypothetical protein ACQEUU_33065 [Nonomuraea sp. CA-218870]|uniref:hypothetical protein n=1 Tax=Nonomuraea sp. CA-218870 TaxID=3239998 RepID=UPI003D8B66A5
MGFIGVILMLQGFGGFVAHQFFDSDFGLLHFWLDGTALTVVSVVLGVLGLMLALASLRDGS